MRQTSTTTALTTVSASPGVIVLKIRQDAVGYGSLRPSAATWRTGRNIRVVFDSGLFSVLYENMTLSKKPAVYNLSQYRQKMTEPRPQVTCTENLLGLVVYEIRKRTDNQNRQTHRHADHNTSHPFRGRRKETAEVKLNGRSSAVFNGRP